MHQPPVIPGTLLHRVEINGGLKRAYQEVTCSEPGCTNVMSIPVNNEFKPADVIMNMAKRRGWQISGNRYKNRICPLHQETKEKPMTSTTEKKPVPTDAARADRRRIFFEIDEAYQGKGYKAGFSDTIIAEKLKVPTSLVAQIREENFGPAGHNMELQRLISVMSVLEDRINKIETSALEALSKAEVIAQDLRKDLALLRDQVTKLENLL